MTLHSSLQRRSRGHAGFTLVELLVAMTLGLLVAGAAVASLIIARQGFNSVDGSSQVRENVRFAASMIERISKEAGFVNVSYGFFPSTSNPVSLQAPLRGYDNARVTIVGAAPTYPTGGVNNSDVLVVNFFGASDPPVDGAAADGSMVNCAGVGEPQNSARPATSIFSVVVSATGDPTLVCTYRDPTTLVWATVPLVQGVESFQILYGTDGVTPGLASPTIIRGTNADTVPESYLTAAQLTVGGNPTSQATLNNWLRVRSLRVGMVLRGPPNSVPDRAATAAALQVLGPGFSSSADPGSTLTIATADGRLRQQFTFTIQLRNTQNPVSLL